MRFFLTFVEMGAVDAASGVDSAGNAVVVIPVASETESVSETPLEDEYVETNELDLDNNAQRGSAWVVSGESAVAIKGIAAGGNVACGHAGSGFALPAAAAATATSGVILGNMDDGLWQYWY